MLRAGVASTAATARLLEVASHRNLLRVAASPIALQPRRHRWPRLEGRPAPTPAQTQFFPQRSADRFKPLSGDLLRHATIVGALRGHGEQGLRLLEQAGRNAGHGCLVRFHAVPYLDDRQTTRIVALDQELARPTARSVTDARNDGAEKVAERRGFVRLGLELVDPGDHLSTCRYNEAA